jgi:AcrR family transcriptional regulator
VARNRATVDRAAKRQAIVDAAAELFVRDGYDATSMTALARAAGVTPNTLYWYFDDKDHLLVAVLDQEVVAALAAHQTNRATTLTEQLLQTVDTLDRLNALTITVHARSQLSPTVASWHDRFHTAGDQWMLAAIRRHLASRDAGGEARVPSDADLAAIPRLWSYAIEGMVAHGLDQSEREALCALLVRQLDAL